jgi:hypothetical protein
VTRRDDLKLARKIYAAALDRDPEERKIISTARAMAILNCAQR